MIEVKEYSHVGDRSPFADWFNDLEATAAAKVAVAVQRMRAGNLSDVKGVGGGVLERRVHWGPGLRIYFGRDGDALIILLGGGTKRRQQVDITNAQDLWLDYKRRKREGRY